MAIPGHLGWPNDPPHREWFVVFPHRQMPNHWDLGIHQHYCGQIANLEFPSVVWLMWSWPSRLKNLIVLQICLIFLLLPSRHRHTKKIPTRPPGPASPLTSKVFQETRPTIHIGRAHATTATTNDLESSEAGATTRHVATTRSTGSTEPNSATKDKISSVRRAVQGLEMCVMILNLLSWPWYNMIDYFKKTLHKWTRIDTTCFRCAVLWCKTLMKFQMFQSLGARKRCVSPKQVKVEMFAPLWPTPNVAVFHPSQSGLLPIMVIPCHPCDLWSFWRTPIDVPNQWGAAGAKTLNW